MGKNDNTLLIIGAAVVGWFLAPKELKEQITSGMPGIGIDLSGFGGALPTPITNIFDGGGISEAWFTEWWEANKPDPFTEVPLLD